MEACINAVDRQLIWSDSVEVLLDDWSKMKKIIFFTIIFVFQQNAYAGVTANVLERVYRFKAGTQVGASFSIDYNEATYLISARHLLKDLKEGEVPQIFTKTGWKKVTSPPIFPKDKNVDIVAYKLSESVHPTLPLEPLEGKITISQLVYFIGYPHGLASVGPLGGKLVEIPFIKSGILSAVIGLNPNVVVMFIDGHNNKGFSGGPVVFKSASSDRFRVAGVIRGYKPEDLPIFDNKVLVDKVVAEGNSGIVISYSIENILDVL